MVVKNTSELGQKSASAYPRTLKNNMKDSE